MTDFPQLRRLTKPRSRQESTEAPRYWLSAPGLILAGLFFTASLTPSLIPRGDLAQGILAGSVAAIGYWIGAALFWLWRYMGGVCFRPGARRALLTVSGLAGLAMAGWGLSRAAAWQNMTREVAGLPPVDQAHVVMIAVLGAALLLGGIVLGLLFISAVRGLAALARRLLPERVALVLGVALGAWLFWAAIDGVLVRRALEAADASFEAADTLVDPAIPQPDDPGKTGSPASLVVWEEMGREGRNFVALAPTAAEIAAFSGGPARDPVRVYVGRRSAETAEARAEIALRELIRQGGFERETLIVMVPTGTGWMDPGGQDTMEFILGGDVATVSVQYSYLTSMLALLVHPQYGIDQAQALFDAVYGHWRSLPKEARPRLYVHGLSQGALNSQSTLPILDLIADPIDGGMWVGSPFIAGFWSHVRDERDPSTPEWLPRFGNGSLVRTGTQAGVDPGAGADWGPMRFVFLNYGSDAIVHFSFESAIREPSWLMDPRAPDVPADMNWIPLVTMFQTALDMAISLQVPRHGHYYVAPDYIDAWAALLDPPGWTAARADALKDLFEIRQGPW